MKIFSVLSIILLSYPALSLEHPLNQNTNLNPIPAIEVGIELAPQLFDKNFTYNNQFTLHHSEHFNLLVTTHITQADMFEQNLITENTLSPAVYLPLNETSHQYGLIGSYSLTSKWQVSGGLIYSKPSLINANEQSNTDNVALIGTSYSF